MSFPSLRSNASKIKNMFKRPSATLLEKSLAVESDTRLFRSLTSGCGLGLVLLVFITTLPDAKIGSIGVIICPKLGIDKSDSHFTAVWKPQLHPKNTVTKRQPNPHSGGPANTTQPKEIAGVLGTKVITSRAEKIGQSAYEIIHKTLQDLPKLDRVAIIHRDAQTRIAGRPGKLNTAFNADYYLNNGNGELDLSGNNGGLGRITAQVSEMPKPKFGIQEQSIDQTNENGSRSTASILAVVKSHSPGLRHLYNRHLRSQPGLQGKVTVRFGIDAQGSVVSAAIEGTTTGFAPFDVAILQAIRSWRFEPVRNTGVEEVVIPLQFSE